MVGKKQSPIVNKECAQLRKLLSAKFTETSFSVKVDNCEDKAYSLLAGKYRRNTDKIAIDFSSKHASIDSVLAFLHNLGYVNFIASNAPAGKKIYDSRIVGFVNRVSYNLAVYA